jgi:hypothetical protein
MATVVTAVKVGGVPATISISTTVPILTAPVGSFQLSPPAPGDINGYGYAQSG